MMGSDNSSLWAHLTWRQVREAAASDPVVLIPIACVETQGPWTPVGMEFVMADRLALDAAERTGSLALPAIPFGNSDSFMNIPGTIFVRPEVLIELYYDVFRSVVRAGFGRILCLSYHIPNQPFIERAARRLREETGVVVAWVNPGALAATFLKELFADPVAARGHGAEPGLSLMRYVLGATVPGDADSGETASSYRGLDVQGAGIAFQGFPVGVPAGWEELYPRTGGFGNPTLGSAEIGEQLYGRILDYLCELIAVVKSPSFTEQAEAPSS
jgi:creatinine amidohydrolase